MTLKMVVDVYEFGLSFGESRDQFEEYSWLPVIWTFKGNRKKFESSGVPVIEGKIIWKMIWREMKITSS